MSSPRLEALRRQFTDVKDGIAVIESKATDAKRDLTDAEQTDVDALYVRAEALKPEIDAEAARQDSISASAAVLARIQPDRPVQTRSAAVGDAPKVTAGEYLSLLWRSAMRRRVNSKDWNRSHPPKSSMISLYLVRDRFSIGCCGSA